jgi:hypothetical protein
MLKHYPAVPVRPSGRGEAFLYGAVFVVMFPPLFVVTLAAQMGRRRSAGARETSLIHEAAADAHSAISIALMDV